MKLTENFSLSEFQSKDNAPMPENVLCNIKVLATNLQVLRGSLGKSITINSGYRSPAHNAKIGGVKNSQHVLGKAADIKVDGMAPKQVATTIERLISEGKMSEGGIGIYNTFTHYDIRGTKARWDYRK